MHYISATHMLERVHPEALVVNDPAAVAMHLKKYFLSALPACFQKR